MIAALVVICVMAVAALAALTVVMVRTIASHDAERAAWDEERGRLINRAIAKHALEVAHLDREQHRHQIPDEQREPRERVEQVGI